jgi:iron complex outermembrane recepter protein
VFPRYPSLVRRSAHRAAVTITFALGCAVTIAAHAELLSRGAQGTPAVSALAPPTERLVVTATRQPVREADTPATVAVVDRADIQDGQLRINLSESLVRVPGLSIQNRQNYAQDLQISSRGFGARASFGIRGLRLYVDDLPATFPDGQGQGAIVPLSAVESLEVLRGPWAGAYGNSAGGVIQATTQASTRSPAASLETIAGGDGLRRFGLRLGSRSSSPAALSGYLDYSLLVTDGFRDHSAARRAQWFGRSDGEGLLGSANSRLTATFIAVDQPDTKDPLGLTAAQWRANPRAAGTNAVEFNTRKSVQHRQLGVTFADSLQALDWRINAYLGTREVEQFLATSVGAQSVATNSGGVIDLARDFAGAALRVSGATGNGASTSWSAGIEWDAAIEQRRGFENFVGVGSSLQVGVRGRERRNEQSRSSNVAAYVQMRGRIGQGSDLSSDRWGWMWSVRASEIAFSTLDRFVAAGNPDDSGGVRYRAFTPAVGLTFAQSPNLQWYASIGRGIETPTAAELAYRPDGAAGLNFGLKPSRSRQSELGLRWQPGEATIVRMVAFDVRSEDEIVPAVSVGGRASFQNAGTTGRTGIELGAEQRFAGDWRASVALTRLEAQFESAFQQSSVVSGVASSRIINAGSLLPSVARLNGFAEIAWRVGQPGLSFAVETVARSAMFADDANSSQAPGNAVANLRVGYRSDLLGLRVQTFLRVDNLADRSTIGSVIVNEANGRFFEPSPGRRISVGVAISLP